MFTRSRLRETRIIDTSIEKHLSHFVIAAHGNAKAKLSGSTEIRHARNARAGKNEKRKGKTPMGG